MEDLPGTLVAGVSALPRNESIERIQVVPAAVRQPASQPADLNARRTSGLAMSLNGSWLPQPAPPVETTLGLIRGTIDRVRVPELPQRLQRPATPDTRPGTGERGFFGPRRGHSGSANNYGISGSTMYSLDEAAYQDSHRNAPLPLAKPDALQESITARIREASVNAVTKPGRHYAAAHAGGEPSETAAAREHSAAHRPAGRGERVRRAVSERRDHATTEARIGEAFVAGAEKTETTGFRIFPLVKTAPYRDERGFRRIRADYGGSQAGQVYTGLKPGAKMEIPV